METELRMIFDTIPEQFDRCRPRYSAELFESLIAYAGIGPGKTVLELGPGTGQATDPILDTGCEYLAVELGKNLCAAMVRKYGGRSNFRIVNDEGLMGFADSLGHVVVTPQFKYAYPFEGGKAKVTYTGQKNDPNDEHWEWVSDDWFYIDYQGRKL